MNADHTQSESVSHLTQSVIELATKDSGPGVELAMLMCHSEDCLIATHEFDTSPAIPASPASDSAVAASA